MDKPETCGECERFFDGHCVPVKDKYGSEPVSAYQAPSVNCPYEYGKCDKCKSPIVDGKCSNWDCK